MRMPQKAILWVLALAVIIVGGFFALNSYIYNEKQAKTASSYSDAEYVIDGQRIRLEDGYLGNELAADLNDDGREDIAFIFSRETGGSGVFYYVAAALNIEEGYVGSQAHFLGDRIAPQTVELSTNPHHKGVIIVNYADRAPGEPMSAQPSVGKSVWLKLDPQAMQFGEVEQGFEGEADSSRMSLVMKDWIWISALYNDGRSIEPREPGRFTLSFADDGRFSATTDCNSMTGSYAADGQSISFDQIAMTLMYCEGSQEAEFLRILENAQLYHFTSRGELVLDLKFDSGTATFR